MAGDFNLHHHMWGGFGVQDQRADSEVLIDLAMGELNLSLCNEPGKATWESHNSRLRPHVLDLVWVSTALAEGVHVEVDLAGRHRGDHAVMRWEVPIVLEEQPRPTVQRESEAARDYISAVAAGIAGLDQHFVSREAVEDACRHLDSVLTNAWSAHAIAPRRTRRSKTWWDAACSQKARLLRHCLMRDRGDPHRPMLVKHALRELRSAVRTAKRTFFDGVIERTHSSRIWDLVQWTRPRPTAAFATLRNTAGEPATTPDAIFQTFREQFYPEQAAPVDLSL
ncbi:hypothetical protein OBBRIDRAFT_523871, partial [Obba rivulosa]